MIVVLKRVIKRTLFLFGISPKKIIDLYRVFQQVMGYAVAYNVNETNYEKNCLLQYIVRPFQESGSSAGESHQNQWQVLAIAAELGKLGYNVDVRDFDDRHSRLKNYYNLVIDIFPGYNDTYKHRMNLGCRRIAYLTGMNHRVANQNEQMRIDNLAKRRGKTVPPERWQPLISKEIERFDAFFFIGNTYNIQSYNEFRLPQVHFIKNNGYEFPYSIKTQGRDPKKFLFFASSGQVHKGLDLLLEIFAQKDFPFELYICSGFLLEKPFCELYQKELFHTSNIHSVGFVDIMGTLFREIVEQCTFALLPSCSEANAGSVLSVMSVGLIPIVSRECGFEDDEVIHLQDCEIETIEAAIYNYASKDLDWLRNESDRVQRIVKERYSQEAFLQSIRKALCETLC